MDAQPSSKPLAGSQADPPRRPLVLGIETSCDDTACAVLDGSGRVLASVVSSQLTAHRPFGGVVPEIASREHLRNWTPVAREALERAGARLGNGLSLDDVDVVAATRGPGLVGSLLVGLSLGKALAFSLGKPFHAVHHLEGHLYSPFLAPPASRRRPGEKTPGQVAGNGGGEGGAAAPEAEEVPDRFLGLVLSGGHTNLFAVEGGEVTTLGETRDDAMGEVFDKVGKRLGLAYPQGPRVDLLAEHGDPAGCPLPVPACGDSLDFSYSGLKSQALVEIEKLERRGVPTDLSGLDLSDPEEAAAQTPEEVLDLMAGFRQAAVEEVLDRCRRLHRRRLEEGRSGEDGGAELLAVSGGAAANRLLRRRLSAWAEEDGVDLRLVPLAFSGDNAAMIAFAALMRQRRGLSDDPRSAEASSRIPFR